jgi:hypothetical protein
MIRYIEHHSIDRQRWDTCMAEAENPMLYGISWYLDIVCPGWDALVYGDYETVMPLPWRSRYGIRYIYQPFFAQQLGVFGKLPGLRTAMFVQAIPSRFRFIDFYLNEFNDSSNVPLVEMRKTQFLSLSLSYKELYDNYDPKLRRNLRRASECRLSAVKISPAEVVTMFRETQGVKLKVFDDKDYKVLEQLITSVTGRGMADNIGVYTADGQLCASACFINTGKSVMYFKSSSYESGKKQRAMHWLLDYYIHLKAGTGKVFDFGGSVVPSIESFYKSFGAQDALYPHIRRNNLPWYIRWLKN